MAWFRRTHSARDSYEPLIGTRVVIEIETRGKRQLDYARSAAVGEIERLEAVFSMYDEQSELTRWSRGEVAAPGPELTAVLSLAEIMRTATRGAFAPGAERLVSRWRQAEGDGVAPPEAELAALVDQIGAEPLDPGGLSLNAIAKGYIVDCCVGLVRAMSGVQTVTVNAGGDICRHGSTPILVRIEDPTAPYDNLQPAGGVELRSGALATSGSHRRGFVVGHTRHSHVIDPRTGWPVTGVLSATVLAPSAAVADALATAMMVLDPDEARSIADSIPGVAMCVVGADGTTTSNDRWKATEP